jgi:hypothetical protein
LLLKSEQVTEIIIGRLSILTCTQKTTHQQGWALVFYPCIQLIQWFEIDMGAVWSPWLAPCANGPKANQTQMTVTLKENRDIQIALEKRLDGNGRVELRGHDFFDGGLSLRFGSKIAK